MLRQLFKELKSFPRSLPGIKSSSVSSYLVYLLKGYPQHKLHLQPMDPCDYCGSRSRHATFFYLFQKSVKCDDCGLEFVERKPLESLDVETDWYNQQSSIEFMDSVWNDREAYDFRAANLRTLFDQANLPFPAPGERALEIGCGKGHFLSFLRDNGLETSGTETADLLVQYCRERLGLDVVKSTISGMDYEAASFDYVFAYHVLEHLTQPSQLFEKSRDALKRGGFLIIESPSSDLTKCFHSQKLDKLHGYCNLGHLHYFTEESLRKYYSRFGFEVLSVYEYQVNELSCGGILGRKI